MVMQINRERIIILAVLCLFITELAAQSSFFPRNIGAPVNTSYSEINPVLSPDGQLLYFSRINYPDNTYGEQDSEDIWVSKRNADGTWNRPEHIMELNIARYNALLSLSSDGRTALLNGIYNKRGTFWKKRGLSVAYKNNDTWSIPERLRIPKLSKRNRGMHSTASMSADGSFIVFSFSRSYNSEKSNLFMSQKKDNGKWTRPVPLKTLNTRYNEEAPFLSPDNKTLYFSSDRKQKGSFDLYKSQRNRTDSKDATWSEPVALSDTINSKEWDSYLRTNAKGSWAFFSSTRGTPGNADIYIVKLFEENPFVEVKGFLKNSISGRILKSSKMKIFANGEPIAATIHPDSGTYKVLLPLGKSHKLKFAAEHYIGKEEVIDASQLREFTRMNQDLQGKPFPYVQLTGALTENEIPLTQIASAAILVNGTPVDSASFDGASGKYKLKLPFGALYKISAQVSKYDALPQTIDLSNVDEYQEINLDIPLSAEKLVTVIGQVIDKKTGGPVAQHCKAIVQVEGEPLSVNVMENGYYELKLPPGKQYVISANAQEYFPSFENINLVSHAADSKVFKNLLIIPIEVGQAVRLNNIFFETGKSVLKKESFTELDRVVSFLKENPHLKIEIGGHTDNTGNASANVRLSEARAHAVADYIVSKGISSTNISSKGYGSSKPVATNKTKSGKAQNRRVEFKVLDK
jgi:outer membrane protein OmpA-like peptidoglycan-associated protein